MQSLGRQCSVLKAPRPVLWDRTTTTTDCSHLRGHQGCPGCSLRWALWLLLLLRCCDDICLLRALITITQYQQQARQSWFCFWREPGVGLQDPCGSLSAQDPLRSQRSKCIYSAEAPFRGSRCSAERGRGALAPAVLMTAVTMHQQNSSNLWPQL